MTYLEAAYRYQNTPGRMNSEPLTACARFTAFSACSSMRGSTLFGFIRRLANEDRSRRQMLRQAGIDVTEQLVLA